MISILTSFVEFRSAVSKKSIMSRQIRGQGGHLVFPIGPKNTNLVEDIEILFPVKFRWIPYSVFRAEVRYVSANQRPGRPSCFFSTNPKNTNLVEDIEILLPAKFRLIPFNGFRGEVEILSQSEARAAILFFPIRPKTQIWKRMLSSCFLSSFIEFCSVVSEEKSKMWKVNDRRQRDDRRTDDGQRVITIVHLSLRLSCTYKRCKYNKTCL